jgi:hypothetical protein
VLALLGVVVVALATPAAAVPATTTRTALRVDVVGQREPGRRKAGEKEETGDAALEIAHGDGSRLAPLEVAGPDEPLR